MVESSTIGNELVAMCIATDLIVSLHYKVRMFGVPFTGAANVFCDNQGVINNTISLDLVGCEQNHNQICYHTVREATEAGIVKEDMEMNLADILTKPWDYPSDDSCWRGSCTEGSWGHFVYAQVNSQCARTDSLWSFLQVLVASCRLPSGSLEDLD